VRITEAWCGGCDAVIQVTTRGLDEALLTLADWYSTPDVAYCPCCWDVLHPKLAALVDPRAAMPPGVRRRRMRLVLRGEMERRRRTGAFA